MLQKRRAPEKKGSRKEGLQKSETPRPVQALRRFEAVSLAAK